MTLLQALVKIRPKAQWVWHGDKYSDLVWLDKLQSKPTEQEILVYITQNEYQEKRVAEYPSIQQQFDLLYHEGYDGWKAVIKVIKDKYPKI